MLEELIAVLDGEAGYEGYRLVRQDGRPQIVDISEELVEEAERARRLAERIASTRLEIERHEAWIDSVLPSLEEATRRLLSIYGRIGAYTRSINARSRWVAYIDTLLLQGRLPSYRAAYALHRMTGIPVEELRRSPEALYRAREVIARSISVRMGQVSELRREAEELSRRRARLISEIRAAMADIRGLRARLEEMEAEYRAVLARVEAGKRVVVDNVDHIDIEITYATETCMGHEPFVAEIHVRTTVIGMDNITKENLKRIEGEMESCASTAIREFLQEYFNIEFGDILYSAMLKTGVRYLYTPFVSRAHAWPRVRITLEYGWTTPDACTAFRSGVREGTVRSIREIPLNRSPRTQIVVVTCP